jgi:hypothetical protein
MFRDRFRGSGGLLRKDRLVRGFRGLILGNQHSRTKQSKPQAEGGAAAANCSDAADRLLFPGFAVAVHSSLWLLQPPASAKVAA